MVHIESDPKGAKAYINDQPVGETPISEKLSNFIGKDYKLTLKKEGYTTLTTMLEKEIKVGGIVGGIFLLPVFLWCYGPEPYGIYELSREDAE